MSRFKPLKDAVRQWLQDPAWSASAPLPSTTLFADADPVSLVNPLIACLPLGGEMTDRAAFALGHIMKKLYSQSPEAAKNVVRRFMWHMNEESGNIGWGIPEAFGQTLAQCPPLADTYRKILFYYVYDAPEDKSTVFCDHAPLRTSCYKAIGILLEARPDFAGEAMPILRIAARDEKDEACRESAKQLVRTHMLGRMPAAASAPTA
ncbi:MAG: HEAT repeat domain-containing protein [Mailhella sp.]|nr:HEAT repeat domain-containing protein [Mailhella sp.]